MLMEALQMLKYDYKKSCLMFTEGMQLDQHDLLDNDPEEPKDVQLMADDETVDSILTHAIQEEGVNAYWTATTTIPHGKKHLSHC